MLKKIHKSHEIAHYLDLLNSSGLLISEFARQHKLNPTTVSKWRERAKKTAAKNLNLPFIPVRVVPEKVDVPRSPEIRLYLRSGHYFEFAGQTSPLFLGKLVEALS